MTTTKKKKRNGKKTNDKKTTFVETPFVKNTKYYESNIINQNT